MWIWWYDCQGCIQSEGINFVQDLPTFLVLLYAFQRFKLDDWGFNIQLDPLAGIRHSTEKTKGNQSILLDENKACELTVGTDKITLSPYVDVIDSLYTLRGRGTYMLAGKTLDGAHELAVKIYWPETSRDSEVKIIVVANELGRGTSAIVDHLPNVICSRDFDYSTDTIRKELDLEIIPQKTRCLCSTAFLRQDPVTELTGKPFVQVWFDCVICEESGSLVVPVKH